MIKKTLLASFVLVITLINNSYAQNETPTYFESGINSPWTVGIDYDLGFAKVLSVNFALIGGFNSQVNKLATFGDIYFGELQIGLRLYMNKIDRWDGLFLSTVLRAGIYNLPFRNDTSQLIISRNNIFQYGFGIYLGYRWLRPLVKDMNGFPFTLILEPYLGWSLDFFNYSGGSQYNRFTVGLSFKIGFYTHKKSKETLEAEQKKKEEEKKANENSEEDNNDESEAGTASSKKEKKEQKNTPIDNKKKK